MKMMKSNGIKRVDHFWQGKGKAGPNLLRIFVIFGIIFFGSNTVVVLGVNLRPLGELEISPEPEPLQELWAFCVTEDKLFIIPDYKAGNIKIYEETNENKKKSLTQVKIIGKKGYGPGDLARPTFCFYNKNESKFGVLDLGTRKIFLYDRIGRIDFKLIKEIPCWRGGTDIQLHGDRLFISGFNADPNGKSYHFYYIDLSNDQTTPLLTTFQKFGFKSFEEYEKRSKEMRDIGIGAWFDIYKDYAYFVWEGNLKITKINIDTKTINSKPFGTQPSHYVKPYISKKLIEAFHKRNPDQIRSEKPKMSYVKNIFVTSKYILLIYEGPIIPGKGSNFILQFYTLDGDFLREVPIPGQPDQRMWFDKDRNILYSLCNKSSQNPEDYFVLKYKIYE
jgi:hypothetical protein